MFTIHRNFTWMKCWICITIFREKFTNQCMEQTNCKVSSKHYTRPYREYSGYVNVKNKWRSQIFYSLVYKFNVCFIRLENLVYQNKLFIIHTIGQPSVQHTTFSQLNITKQIFLNIYHFPSTLVLLKHQDPFIEDAIFESCLSCSFLVWAQNFRTIQW